jgi:heavy metal translocating P-type ATPase
MQVTMSKYGFVTFALGSAIAGLLLANNNQQIPANIAWSLGAVMGLFLSVRWLIQALKEKSLGSDALAVISIIATALTSEWFAASVISVMLATGRALEVWAEGRASSHLDALINRAPINAHVYRDEQYVDLPLAVVPKGSLILIRAGEVVPLDGILQSESIFDESALTGEPEPVWRAKDTTVQSGVVNAGGSVVILTTTNSADSTYANLINLVASARAQATKGVRLANKWAIRFVPIALLMALATWLISGDIKQAVAVIVAATPCPLILAVPVAIVSGISRAAKFGVIIKNGSALEQLSRVEVLLMDKTGTLTEGGPRVSQMFWAPNVAISQTLSLAASLEQHSSNIVARALVQLVRERQLPFHAAENVTEVPGHGLSGLVGGKNISVGQPTSSIPEWATLSTPLIVEIKVEGEAVGFLGLSDPIRTDSRTTIEELRTLGVKRILLVSGDRQDTVTKVANELGITEYHYSCKPEEKLQLLNQAKQASRGSVAVVGDGINDAPALAAADVGIAMVSKGATAASQSSDVVIVEDSIRRLSQAVSISKSATNRALQASTIGMSLALIAMTAAAFGFLSPSQSALVQEAVDAASIIWALTSPKHR